MRLVLRCQSLVESSPGSGLFTAAFGPAAGVTGHRVLLEFPKGGPMPRVGSTYTGELIGDGIEESPSQQPGASDYVGWNSYGVGQVVSYNGTTYRCTRSTTPGILPTDTGYWTVQASPTAAPASPLQPSADFVGWDPLATYGVGQVVSYSGTRYRCTAGTTAGILPTDTRYWTALSVDSPASAAPLAAGPGGVLATGPVNPAGWPPAKS